MINKNTVGIILFLLVFHASPASTDPVGNVRYYRVTDERIVIYYDLSETESVTVKFSLDGGTGFTRIINGLSGDIGEDVSPGLNKRIVWDITIDTIIRSKSIIIIVETRVDSPIKPVLTVDYKQKAILAHRIDSPIILDGLSDEPAWEKIEPFPVVMQMPIFNSEPSERTEIRLAYDDDYLYVAASLYDSQPELIHATSMKRDYDEENSDSFGIVLDTFNDNENGLSFITTPTGSRIDKAIYGDLQGGGSGAGGANSTWNTFWDVKTVRNGDGWFAEMRIPFSSLRFQESDDRVVMGFSAYRWIARKDERIVFPAISQEWGTRSHMKPSKAGKIAFTGLRSHKPLYFTPYLLGGLGHSYNLNSTNTGYKKDEEPAKEAGFDLKYGITSNMTLDVTVNTDFAQVEADDQQVNLTRFSLFFPEKRLFFLERASNFDFNFYGRNRLFHSRRIGIHNGKQVPIYGGARLVGRIGKWDLGFLSMQTDETEELTTENFGVLRLRRQAINQYSYLGGILTSRMGTDGSYNSAYGFDGIIRVFGDDYLKFNWAQTFENDRDNDPADIDISKIRVHWERYRHVGWAYGLNYSRAGKDYNPGMGFEQYNNLSNYIHFARYGWNSSRKSLWYQHEWYEDLWLHIRNEDYSVKSCLARTGWHGSTKSGYNGAISLTYNYEDVEEKLSFSEDADVPMGTYEFYGVMGNFSTPSGRLFTVISSFNAGEFYDGSRVSLSLSPSRSISSYMELGGTYQLNCVDFSNRNQEFTSHIGRLRLLAMLSARFSMTAFVQYSSAADKTIANIRFRYNPREGNDLYLVYDEGINTDREREDPLLPFTSDRTVMLKYNYTFKL